MIYNFRVMRSLRGLSDMRLPFPHLKASWDSHAIYSHYGEPITPLYRIKLLETQTGR